MPRYKKTEPDEYDELKNNTNNNGPGRKLKKLPNKVSVKSVRTRTIIFVEQTVGGKLAKTLREVLRKLEHILGFRVKVVEMTGTSLRNSLPNTNPWSGSICGRTDCITCTQDSEEIPPCTKRNLVYENICTICNPEATKKGQLPLEKTNLEVSSIYVGETARSVHERSKEHWADFRKEKEDSHIFKHQIIHHGSEEP